MTTLQEDAVGVVVRPEADHVLGEVQGDRTCVSCGFNLHAQRILREPHYGLLIVRCPECSRVTSLQEYPVLGRWGKRWGVALVGVYLLLMVGVLVLSGLGCGAFAVEASDQFRRSVASDIARAHVEWFDSTGQAAAILSVPANTTGPSSAAASLTIGSVHNWGPVAPVNQAWWENQGRAAMAKKSQYRTFNREPENALAFMAFGLAVVGLSAFFATVAPGLRGLRLLVIPVIVLAIAGLLVLVAWDGSGFIPGVWLPGYASAMSLADELVPGYFKVWLLAGTAVAMLIGLFLGRPTARGLVRLFLPPRYARALTYLWVADGREYRAPRRQG